MQKQIVLKDLENLKWAEITFNTDQDYVSFTGSHGDIIVGNEEETVSDILTDQAVNYWSHFFYDNKEEIGDIVTRFPDYVGEYLFEGYSASEACAKVVIDLDGNRHGLDIFEETDDSALMYNGGGQCYDEILELFPQTKNIVKFWKSNQLKTLSKLEISYLEVNVLSLLNKLEELGA